MIAIQRLLLTLALTLAVVSCNAKGKNTTPVIIEVTGLAGNLVLTANYSEWTITENGTFTRDLDLRQRTSYDVSVKTQPTDQTCSVSNGSGVYQSQSEIRVGVSCAAGSGGGAGGGSGDLNSIYITALIQNQSTGGSGAQPGYWYGGNPTILSKPSGYESATLSWGTRGGSDIYISGSSSPGSDAAMQAVYWKNGSFTALPSLDASQNSSSYQILVEGSDVYVSGNSQASGGITVAGYWKNGTFQSLLTDDTSQSAEARGIAVSGSSVYVAGQYLVNDSGTNVYKPGYWKDGTWTLLDYTSGGRVSAQVGGIIVKGSDVYVAGSGSLGSSRVVGYWKNGSWVKLADFTPQFASEWPDDAGIFAIDDDIYITSDFQTSAGTGGYYKNDVYISLPPFRSGKDCRVKSIAKVGSAVVAGGWCHDEMNSSNTGYWIISESSPVFKDLGGRTYGGGGHVIP